LYPVIIAKPGPTKQYGQWKTKIVSVMLGILNGYTLQRRAIAMPKLFAAQGVGNQNRL